MDREHRPGRRAQRQMQLAQDRRSARRLSVLRYLSLALACMAGGCTSLGEGAGACVGWVELPSSTEQCVGLFDIEYTYKNSPPYLGPSGQPIEIRVAENPWARQHYVAQDNENGCYAAALQSAFSQWGHRYQQSDFESALGHQCFGTAERPLSFSQIVFSATRTHFTNRQGVWFIDTPDNFGSRSLNQFASMAAARKPGRYASNYRTTVFEKVKVCETINGGKSSSFISVGLDFDAMIARRLGIPQKVMQANNIVQYGAVAQPALPTMPGLMPIPALPGLPGLSGVPVMQPGQPVFAQGTPESVKFLHTFSFYKPQYWETKTQGQTVRGGIVPIVGTGDLVTHLDKGVPILVGLKDPDAAIYGHVVLVRRVTYVPGSLRPVLQDDGSTMTFMNTDTHLQLVEVLDPARPAKPERAFLGDEFMSRARFIFALYAGH